MLRRCMGAFTATLLCGLLPLTGCGGGNYRDKAPAQNTSSRANSLSSMFRVNVGIKNTNPGQVYDCWVAADPGQRLEGLSYVSAGELPGGSRRGMIFVFPGNSIVDFWGKDTFIPLDIAFAVGTAEGVGRIVKIGTIDPYQRTIISSDIPAKYVIEVPRGDLALSGAKVGDTIFVPVTTPKN
jgi:uncharacterized membrane protein (UPF0127 family)